MKTILSMFLAVLVFTILSITNISVISASGFELEPAPGGGGSSDDEEYILTATSGSGGSISPSGNTYVDEGNNQTYYISPDNGYEISKISVNGQTRSISSSFTLYNISSNKSIYVDFVKTPEASIQEGYLDIEDAHDLGYSITEWEYDYEQIYTDAPRGFSEPYTSYGTPNYGSLHYHAYYSGLTSYDVMPMMSNIDTPYRDVDHQFLYKSQFIHEDSAVREELADMLLSYEIVLNSLAEKYEEQGEEYESSEEFFERVTSAEYISELLLGEMIDFAFDITKEEFISLYITNDNPDYNELGDKAHLAKQISDFVIYNLGNNDEIVNHQNSLGVVENVDYYSMFKGYVKEIGSQIINAAAKKIGVSPVLFVSETMYSFYSTWFEWGMAEKYDNLQEAALDASEHIGFIVEQLQNRERIRIDYTIGDTDDNVPIPKDYHDILDSNLEPDPAAVEEAAEMIEHRLKYMYTDSIIISNTDKNVVSEDMFLYMNSQYGVHGNLEYYDDDAFMNDFKEHLLDQSSVISQGDPLMPMFSLGHSYSFDPQQ